MPNFTHRISCFLSLLLLGTIVVAQPTITSFTPSTAMAGATITIAGTNFNATAANNVVYFGTARATPITSTTTQLTVQLPTGASYAPITVINTGTNLIGESLQKFMPQFAPAKPMVGASDFTPGASIVRAGWQTRAAVPVDFDSDGLPDLAVAGAGNDVSHFRAFLYPNTSAASTIGFAAPIVTSSSSVQFPLAVSTGDLNGDGKPEVGYLANNTGSVLILNNGSTGPGNFDFTTFTLFGASGANAQAMDFMDVDLDGKLDIVTVLFGGTLITRLNTTTSGIISFAPAVNTVTGISDGPISIFTADIDTDGKKDVIIGKLASGTFSIYRNTSTLGSASFAAPVNFTIAGSGTNLFAGCGLADINNDGLLDIIGGFSTATTFSVYPNNSVSGTITLGTPVTFPCGDFGSIGVSDLNGDGKADVTVFLRATDSLQVLTNTYSTGVIDANAFSAPVALQAKTGNAAINPNFADMNGDGQMDIITADIGGHSVTVLRNNPAVTWYSSAAGSADLDVSTNWGLNLNGTGVSPIDFDNTNHTFVLANQPTNNYAISGNWFVGGTLQIPANATLRLNATLDFTNTVVNNGNIVVAPTGGLVGKYSRITGTRNITVQRNFVGQRGWRILSNPFNSPLNIANTATTNNIAISTTPGVGGTTDTRVFNNATNSWSNISAAAWAPNSSFALFYRGTTVEVSGLTYTAGPAGQVYSISGAISADTVTITPTTAGNFMIVGNPFYANVTTRSLTGGQAAPYYTYRIVEGATLAERRQRAGSWILAGANSSTAVTIPVLGTLAYLPANTNSFNITADNISTDGMAEGSLFRTQAQPFKQLGLDVVRNGVLLDRLFIRNNAEGTVPKFTNDICNFYVPQAAGTRLASLAKTNLDTVPLGIQSARGVYQIKVSEQSLPANLKPVLVDKFTGVKQPLEVGTVYEFTISDSAQSFGNQRFEVVMSADALVRPVVPQPVASSLIVTLQSGNIGNNNCIIKVDGAFNNMASTVVRTADGNTVLARNVGNGVHQFALPSIAGVYFIEVNDGKSKQVLKVVL